MQIALGNTCSLSTEVRISWGTFNVIGNGSCLLGVYDKMSGLKTV